MRILALDTTSDWGSVALLEDDHLLAEVAAESNSSHSVRLMKAVDFLLQQFSLSLQKIDGFAVAAGPGSFTGIRVGLSTVKALARASGKLVAPVSSLRALALKLNSPEVRLIVPMIDARKGEIFAALFSREERWMKEVLKEGAWRPEYFLSQLPARRIIHFIGSGVRVYQEKINIYLQDRARFSSRSWFIAHEVGILGWEMLKEGKGMEAPGVEPIYYRPSQAEEKLPSGMKFQKTS